MSDSPSPWISPRELTNLYKHVAANLRESGEIAGEGFILRLAEITVDAALEALHISVGRPESRSLSDFDDDHGPFDPDELVQWATSYGHPEGWAKKAQQLHGENERLRQERQAVLDCVNLYGDETLHKALDAIGWPHA